MLSKIGNAVCVLLLALVLGIGILYLCGIHPAIVLSGSMEPEIKTGSLCFVNTKTEVETIELGDIIAYRTGDIRVTHRVIDITADGFQTKGDANDAPDISVVPKENVIGKTVFWVPYLGMGLAKLNTTPGRVLMGCVLALLFLGGLLHRKTEKSDHD